MRTQILNETIQKKKSNMAPKKQNPIKQKPETDPKI